MSKNYTVISDLTKKLEIDDTNLIIVEDNEDTKQATVLDLKKSLSGDYKEPSDKTFYSSQKIENYMNDMKRELSTFASDEDLKSVSKRVEDIVAVSSASEESIKYEVAEARNGNITLNARLNSDIINADDRFMKKISRVMEGKEVSTGNFGYIDIYLSNMSSSVADITFASKNQLNMEYNTNTDQVIYDTDGFVYTQKNNSDLVVSLKFENSIPKGKYFFFANIDHDALFKDKGNIIFAVRNSKDDSAYTEFTYDQTGKFVFEAPKAFNEIKLIFNAGNFVSNAKVEYTNVMLMRDDKYEDRYIPYDKYSVTISKGEHLKGYNADYDITCSDANAIIRVEYYDNEVTAETMQNDIDELKTVLIDNRDKCGLIENYGEYLFFDNAICETPTSCRISYDNDKFMRNGVATMKAVFEEDVDVNPVFALQMTDYVETIDSVSLVFYVDKTVSYYFTASEPITISVCSDSYTEPEMANYLTANIRKDELVQGWNIIKKNINDFTSVGVPNAHGIKYVKIEVAKNASLDNRPIYFNSVIFNQKMKPTVLLAFDGIYNEGIEYTYPYLTTRGIPATILSNNRSTLATSVLETVFDLRAKYGWDLGQYGCNPNKELLTQDDNGREQYLALKIAKEWLRSNLVYDPISYSAPYGNLRPISVPILKDLGYKIAKMDSTGYCNFFDPKYDFAIPTMLITNTTTEDEILYKLQYAIDNNCCVCLYTNNVTEYGDEQSAKKTLLERVVKFILDNKDKLTAMTFSEFYNKCNS